MNGIKRVVALIAVASAAMIAAADGCFMAHGIEAKPTIPYQRAFLSWRAGKETLIVESVLSAQRGDYAWVVPLPAVPEKVRACTPGTLESVALLSRPAIVRASPDAAKAALLAFALVGFAGLWTAVRPTKLNITRTRQFLELVFLGVIILGCPSVLLFPVYAGINPGHALGADVVVHAAGNAGAYSYEVVSSTGAKDLRDWLGRNGYSLPTKAEPSIDAYVRKGWCFAAMKLRHDLQGSAAPNPVRFVFDSKQPVYPMALTGATNDRLRLDLFVVAGGLAQVRGLEMWRAQPVERKAVTAATLDYGHAIRNARVSWEPIGHPEIVGSLWEGATLTYLRGDLRGEDMTRDYMVAVGAKPAHETSKSLYTSESASCQALGYGLFAAAALLFILTVWATHKPFGLGRFACVFAVSAALGAAGGAAWFAGATKVPTTLVDNPMKQRAIVRTLEAELARGRAPGDTEPFPDWWLDRLKEGPPHDVPTEGDVPGGYTIKRTPGGWIVTFYDLYANPTEYRVSKKGDVETGL